MALYAIAALFLAAQQPAAPQGAPAESPAMTAARANRARLKTTAVFKSGPRAEIPEAALAAGEFGKVTVSGIIGADGRFSELKVVDSSRSERLDAAALAAAAASVFEPARDAAGEPIAILARMPFEFTNAKSAGKGGGVLRYRCDQFARDYDWWYRTWPADKHDDFYFLVLGFSTIAKSQGANGRLDYEKFGSVNKDFDARWRAAVEACRAKPDRLFIDVFKPEGDMLKRMAGG